MLAAMSEPSVPIAKPSKPRPPIVIILQVGSLLTPPYQSSHQRMAVLYSRFYLPSPFSSRTSNTSMQEYLQLVLQGISDDKQCLQHRLATTPPVPIPPEMPLSADYTAVASRAADDLAFTGAASLWPRYKQRLQEA
jgi:hypothetical protein